MGDVSISPHHSGICREFSVAERAAALMAQRFLAGAPVLGSSDRTRQYLRHQIGILPYEVFGRLLLDTRHRLIRAEILFRGTIDGASVHPREVARVVLESNAAAVIFFHNHPSSGVAEPSTADERITKRLNEALRLIDVRVLDQLIIGNAQLFRASRRMAAGRLTQSDEPIVWNHPTESRS